MNEQEVIKYLEMAFDNSDGYDLSELYKDMCRTAIKACKKQIPKKVNKETKDSYDNVIPRCPSCSKMFVEDYCSKCGQKIDWTVEE